MQKSCIVIPIHRFDLSRDEEFSWTSLIQSLPQIPKIIVAPRRFRAAFQYFRDVKILFFEEHYFTYPKGYNSLLLSKKFYQAFSSFRNILIYQLDCLICDSSRANLLGLHWCPLVEKLSYKIRRGIRRGRQWWIVLAQCLLGIAGAEY